MARNRDKNPDESLRGNLRQLRSENKHLRRQVARLEKQVARLPITEDSNLPELPDSSIDSEVPDSSKCPKCGKEMILIDLTIRKILSCKRCSTRITLKD